MTTRFPVILVGVLLAGCGGGSSPEEQPVKERVPKLTVSVGESEDEFVPVYATFATFRRGLIVDTAGIADRSARIEAVVHRIYLANYDLNLTDPAKQDYRRINADGQFRVEIQLEAEENARADAPVRAGEYRPASAPFNRVSWVAVSKYANGKDSGTMLGGSSADGTVTITSATETEISGKINFSGRDGSVRGSFTATKL